jgi:hypothetical protein
MSQVCELAMQAIQPCWFEGSPRSCWFEGSARSCRGLRLLEKHGLHGSWYHETPVRAAFQLGKSTLRQLRQHPDREQQGAERSAAPAEAFDPKQQGAECSAAPAQALYEGEYSLLYCTKVSCMI